MSGNKGFSNVFLISVASVVVFSLFATIVMAQQVKVCEHADFGGGCKTFTNDVNYLSNIGGACNKFLGFLWGGNWDKCISSIEISADSHVLLYTSPDFKGASVALLPVIIYDDLKKINGPCSKNWNDCARSLQVRKNSVTATHSTYFTLKDNSLEIKVNWPLSDVEVTLTSKDAKVTFRTATCKTNNDGKCIVIVKSSEPGVHKITATGIIRGSVTYFGEFDLEFLSGCTRKNPTVTFNPDSQSSNTRETKTYTIEVKNNDEFCGEGAFNLVPQCPADWTCKLASNSITIADGQTKSVQMEVTPPQTAGIGNYKIQIDAVNEDADNKRSGLGSADYVISALPTACHDEITNLKAETSFDTSGSSVALRWYTVQNVKNYEVAWCKSGTYEGGDIETCASDNGGSKTIEGVSASVSGLLRNADYDFSVRIKEIETGVCTKPYQWSSATQKTEHPSLTIEEKPDGWLKAGTYTIKIKDNGAISGDECSVISDAENSRGCNADFNFLVGQGKVCGTQGANSCTFEFKLKPVSKIESPIPDSESVSFSIDYTEPSISINSVQTALSGDPVEIIPTATDEYSGIKKIEIFINNDKKKTCEGDTLEAVQSFAKSKKCTLVQIFDSGTFQYKAVAEDNAGNKKETQAVTIQVSKSPNPVSTIKSPNDGEWVGDFKTDLRLPNGFQVEIVDVEGDDPIEKCFLSVIDNGITRVDNAERTCGTSANPSVRSINNNNLQGCATEGVGTCKVCVKSKDTAGRESKSDCKTYNVDRTKPFVSDLKATVDEENRLLLECKDTRNGQKVDCAEIRYRLYNDAGIRSCTVDKFKWNDVSTYYTRYDPEKPPQITQWKEELTADGETIGKVSICLYGRDELNNIVDNYQTTVVERIIKSDLTIKEITGVTEKLEGNSYRVDFTIKVLNDGFKNAKDVGVQFKVGGVALPVEPAKADVKSKEVVAFDATATLDAGRHSVEAVVDPSNKIVESDENNNRLAQEVDVGEEVAVVSTVSGDTGDKGIETPPETALSACEGSLPDANRILSSTGKLYFTCKSTADFKPTPQCNPVSNYQNEFDLSSSAFKCEDTSKTCAISVTQNGCIVQQPSCSLSVSPSSGTGSFSSTIRVNYNRLASAPNSIDIDCGDGNSVTADGCSGTTGTCSARCTYPIVTSTETYTASASIDSLKCTGTIVTNNPQTTLSACEGYQDDVQKILSGTGKLYFTCKDADFTPTLKCNPVSNYRSEFNLASSAYKCGDTSKVCHIAVTQNGCN